MSFFDNLQKAVKSSINMSNCSFCSVAQTETGVCEACLTAISTDDLSCSRCASPLSKPAESNSLFQQTLEPKLGQQIHHASLQCGQCLSAPPKYQRVITASRYKFPIDKALSEFKFNKQLHYARSLCHVLEKTIKQNYLTSPYPQALVAIPLHPQRLKERGFNQSDIIAKHLSQSFAIPKVDALTRIKDTPHQIGLSEKQRRKNLNNAFYLRQSLPSHVAIIDDVVTTGSTVNEAAKLCLKNGVEQVDIWCLAKT